MPVVDFLPLGSQVVIKEIPVEEGPELLEQVVEQRPRPRPCLATDDVSEVRNARDTEAFKVGRDDDIPVEKIAGEDDPAEEGVEHAGGKPGLAYLVQLRPLVASRFLSNSRSTRRSGSKDLACTRKNSPDLEGEDKLPNLAASSPGLSVVTRRCYGPRLRPPGGALANPE